MNSTEEREHLPALPLAPAVPRPQRRLLRGQAETAVVRALTAQRERYCQSGSRVSLCLTQDELAEQLGLVRETPTDRRRAVWTLQQTIWRVNSKLAAQDLIIASLHSSLGPPRYAIFRLHEIWAS